MHRFLGAPAVAVVLLAGIVGLGDQSLAAPITITGNFSVTSSNGWRAQLRQGEFGGAVTTSRSGSETLNGSFSLTLPPNPTSKFTLFSVINNLSSYWWNSTSTITVSFANLSDGTADTFCSSDCSASANLYANTSTLTFNPTSFVVHFEDGAVLQIVDGCGNNYNEINEEYEIDLDQEPKSPVPEPSSFALLGTGVIALGFGRFRRRGGHA